MTGANIQDQKCRACGSAMPLGAYLCKECSSYQGWRRFLGTSSTTLALITALISVLSLSIPVLAEYLLEKKSHIEVELQGDDRSGGLLLLATNTGKRAGGIRSIYLGVPLRGGDSKIYDGVIDLKVGSMIVEPGKTALIRATFNASELSRYTIFDVEGGKCNIKVRLSCRDTGVLDQNFDETCDSLPTIIPFKRPGL